MQRMLEDVRKIHWRVWKIHWRVWKIHWRVWKIQRGYNEWCGGSWRMLGRYIGERGRYKEAIMEDAEDAGGC
jgi:hypothetical protein